MQFRPAEWRSLADAAAKLSLVMEPEECGARGIQFQPFHFCAHCEGQTLTGTISLPSPILCLPASALTQQCSYTDL